MKRRRPFPPALAIVIVIALIYGAYSFIITISQRGQKLEEISENKKQITELDKDIKRLKGEIKSSHSPEFVEKVARDEFGMVKPREVVYIDKDKQDNKINSNDSNLQEVKDK